MRSIKIAFAVILIVVLACLFVSWLTSLMWWWVVPDLFRSAVEKGVVPATLTLWQAFKLSLLMWALALAGGVNQARSH